MATAVQKITLSPARDIPFNKLVLSQKNVRRVKAGVSIEELAASIARRGLIQSLNVRPVVDAEGNETGMFEVPAGGRRFRALELLTKQKRLAKTALVPCVVRPADDPILDEEVSLVENTERVDLHPLDEFRAFQDMRLKGTPEEDIAAAHRVTVQVVKQRLRLAAVSPNLLDVYAEDGMTLEQLMAFTVTNDHARQELVWESISKSWSKEPYQIRRMLNETTVRASDMEAGVKSVYLSVQDDELKDSPSARAVQERHDAWAADVPKDDDALWDWLAALDDASRMALMAHCVSFGVNALYERPNPHSASGISQHTLEMRLAQADRLARATGLDMVDVGWKPTVGNYLGRVTKPRILQAVREGVGEQAAQLIDHLKKGDMAKEAERLLADAGWLPEPLRLIDSEPAADSDAGDDESAALPDFLSADDEEDVQTDAEDDEQHLVAAE
jgi:ParB/RepB/Spo0J family partition protein